MNNTIETLHIGGYEVLLANDREPGEQADAWKYKVIGPRSTWSIGWPTRRECLANARQDVADSHGARG